LTVKRIWFLALSLFGLIVLAALLGVLGSARNAPRFRPFRQPFRVRSYQNVYYDFLAPSPFEHDKMWISAWSGTNDQHCFLYDIERKTVLGELFNARPQFITSDQSQVLCLADDPAPRPSSPSASDRLQVFFRNLRRGKFSFMDLNFETVWKVNLERGAAARLGSFSDLYSADSFAPSPSSRFAYCKPPILPSSELFICDLQAQTLSRRLVDGWPAGWWSDSEIIFKGTNSDYFCYDVLTEKRELVFSAAAVIEAFAKASLGFSPAQANLFSTWNGHENEFYLTDFSPRWLATNCYLFKIERAGPALKLVAARFKFEWSDHFAPGGTRYVYSGRDSGVRSSGVFLRELDRNIDHTLVPPDASKSFSLPNFYHDSVIYARDNKLWQVDLSGSKSTQLFPPPDDAPSSAAGP
jgi:hypothetical protein